MKKNEPQRRMNGVRYTAPDFLQPAVVLPNTRIIPDNRMFYHGFEKVLPRTALTNTDKA
jgi:hypothetical protein